jgi:ABC-type cobalamin transport system permease subunit
MMMLTGNDWDGLGQLLMALGIIALLAYLAPATLRLTPEWRRRSQTAALVLVGIALIIAIGATVAWFMR